MDKELTYQEILNAFDAFASELVLTKLGWKLSLYASRNIDYLKPHVDHYGKASRELLREHSVEKEVDGELQRVVLPAKILTFREEEQKLFDTKVSVEYDQLDFEALSEENQEKLEEAITPKIMYGIKYTFKD